MTKTIKTLEEILDQGRDQFPQRWEPDWDFVIFVSKYLAAQALALLVVLSIVWALT